MSDRRWSLLPLLLFCLTGTLPAADPQPLPAPEWNRHWSPFAKAYCLSCHSGETPEAGLNLEALPFDLTRPETVVLWEAVYWKLLRGQMPPLDSPQPALTERRQVAGRLAARLQQSCRERQTREGRVQYRRLNRTEYENSLRALLALPQLDVWAMLPADGDAHGFDKVGSALNLSEVQLARYLEASGKALEEAMVFGPRPQEQTRRIQAREQARFVEAVRNQEAVPVEAAVGLMRQPGAKQDPWSWTLGDLPLAGHYQIRLKAFGFLWERGEVRPADRAHVLTLQAGRGPARRPLGSFDVAGSTAEDGGIELTGWLKPGDGLELRIETLDGRLKPAQQPLLEYTAPGVAAEWLELTGPLIEEWPPASYRHLFGDLPNQPWTPESGLRKPPPRTVSLSTATPPAGPDQEAHPPSLYHVVPRNPREDADRLLHRFAERAFRRPVAPAELADIRALVEAKLDGQDCFQEALQIGYQAILCSPEFLFLQEQPGKLDDYALASRLAYFLWNSPPDEELRQLAGAGRLGEPAVLRQQVDRLLQDHRSSQFVRDFTGQWLDLWRIRATDPDEDLYPEFDPLLLESMQKESYAWFREMLDHDLGPENLIDSDVLMINGRLAELYGIPEVTGVEIRPVKIPVDSVRGGFLTQASILKVTANGTSTSPVIRGAWVLDRLLGQPAPPPPPNIPAVEPDLRGTTTIREQLSRHREIKSCAVCHQHLDPPGFALESFDVIGGFRTRYRSLLDDPQTESTAGGELRVKYTPGPAVDASGRMPDGQEFQDVNGFRQILLGRKDQLARNLVERLLVYSTGAGVQFSDREVVEDILERSRESGYGLRTLIHEVVQSRIFRVK